jgi:hypothetical protein
VVTKTRLRLAIPAVLLALGATACGGGNTKQLDDWATTLCGGMQGPVQQADTALADTGTVKAGETPTALRVRLVTDLGTLATANGQIALAVQKAGPPKVDDGTQTEANAMNELTQAVSGYTSVQQAVAALPVTDQAKFAAGLKGVGDKLQQVAELSTSALQQLQTGDLGTALAKQPGCKSVSASTSAGTAPAATGTSGTGGTGTPTAPTAPTAPAGSAAPSGSGSAKPGSSGSPGGSASASARPSVGTSRSATPDASASTH